MSDSTVINMENPLMSQAAGMAVWTKLRQLPEYIPAEVKWRGNPCTQPGDILQFEVTDGVYTNHIITSQTFHFASGFYADSTSAGSPMTLKEANPKTTTDKQINRVTSDVDEKVDKATDGLKQDIENLTVRVESVEMSAAAASANALSAAESSAAAVGAVNDLSSKVENNTSAIASVKADMEQVRSSLQELSNRVSALEGITIPSAPQRGSVSVSAGATGTVNFHSAAGMVAVSLRGQTATLVAPGSEVAFGSVVVSLSGETLTIKAAESDILIDYMEVA